MGAVLLSHTVQSRFFVDGYTSSFWAPKRHPWGSRVGDRLISSGSSCGKPYQFTGTDKGQWPYLVCGPHSPRQGAPNGLLCYFLGRMFAMRKPTMPSSLQPLVLGCLFGELGPAISTASHLRGGQNPGSRSMTYSITLRQVAEV